MNKFAILFLLALSFGCQREPEATQDLFDAPQLAMELPAGAVIFSSIPDMSQLRDGARASYMGRTFQNEEVQEFLAEFLIVLEDGWGTVRGSAEMMGFDPELLKWESWKSASWGAAIQLPEVLNPDIPAFDQATFSLLADVTLAAPESAKAFLAGLEKLEMLEALGEVVPQEDGSIRLRYQRPQMEYPLWVWQDGARILMRLESGQISGPRLSDSKEFQRDWGEMQNKPNRSHGLLSWVNVREAKNLIHKAALTEADREDVQQYLANEDKFFGSLESVSLSSGWEQGATVSDLVLYSPQESRSPFLEWGTADREMLTYIPANATSASIGSVPVGNYANQLFSAFDVVVDDRLQVLADTIGSRIWSWNRTIGMKSEGINAVEVTDVDKLTPVLESAMRELRDALAEDPFGPQIRAKRVKLRVKDEAGKMVDKAGPAFFSLVDWMPDAGQAVQMIGIGDPTFALHPDGWLLFSLGAGPIKSALRGTIQPLEKNIQSHTLAGPFFLESPDNASVLSWGNPRPQIEGYLSLAQLGLGVAASFANESLPPDFPLDLKQFPSTAAWVNEIQPSKVVATTDSTRLSFHSRTSFGLADSLVAVGTLISLAPTWLMLADEGIAAPGALEF